MSWLKHICIICLVASFLCHDGRGMKSIYFYSTPATTIAQPSYTDQETKVFKLIGQPLFINLATNGNEAPAAIVELPRIIKDKIASKGLAASSEVFDKINQLYPKLKVTFDIQVNGDTDISDVIQLLGAEIRREKRFYFSKERVTSKQVLPPDNTLPEGYRYGVATISKYKIKNYDQIEWYKFKPFWLGVVEGKVKSIMFLHKTERWIDPG